MFNKKITLIILLTLFFANFVLPSFSIERNADVNCVNFCPQKPYPISNFILRGIQKITFINFTASKIAEYAVEKQILKQAKGDFDVDIDSYSAIDLINGKLKTIEVNAKDVEFQDLYFSKIQAKSVFDFISMDYKASPPKLRVPLSIDFSGIITENDLNRMLRGQKYKNQLIDIKNKADNLKLIDFANPRATLKNNRVQIITDFKMSVIFDAISFPLTVDSDFQIVNNKIKLSNAKISTGSKKIDIDFPDFFIDMMNPFIVNLAGLESNGKKVTVKKVIVNNKQIEIAGNLWFPQDK